MERIQKILARGGIASRRAAEQLIVAGRVRVNGRVVTELGTQADERRDRIEVDGKRVVAEDFVYVVLHKPRGVVATMSDPEGRPTVREILGSLDARVYPVGRLDFATSGVLLMTNDGAFADGLLHPRREVPKTYAVKVKGAMKDADVDRWRKGIELEDGVTLPAEVRGVRHEGDKTWFELTIREGRNQQIRRMGEAAGFPVMRLARLSFAGITGERLAPGAFRHLTRDELITLKKTYGVPKSVSTVAAAEAKGRGARGTKPTKAVPVASRGAAARFARGVGKDVREERGARGPGREASEARPPRGRAVGQGRGASEERAPRGKAPARAGGSSGASRTEGPRYGGGSPGRRSYDVTEDWGGGARRGSSGGRYEGRSDAPGPQTGGRGGRTRTTGTAGGVGAREDAGTVKRRR